MAKAGASSIQAAFRAEFRAAEGSGELASRENSAADGTGLRQYFEGGMNSWKRFYDDFKALMDEEDRIVQQRVPRNWFYAHVTFGDLGEFGYWLANITTESLQARFELLATEAGIALGSPFGTQPQAYWLHRLFLDLRANNSDHIRLYNERGGIIERLFEASATYCARLDRCSLEKAATHGEGQEDQSSNDFARTEEAIAASGPAPVRDVHLELLELILKKKTTTLEKWASVHRLGRTSMFDWKSGRTAGKSCKGKVSAEKAAEIEAAIMADAAELGLVVRADSD